MPKPLFVLSLIFLSGATSGAQDLHVGPTGSGAPFLSIQSAIDIAIPGQRIVIAAGDYQESLIVDRAVEIVGAGPELTRLRPEPDLAAQTSPPLVRIQGIQAGRRLRFSGIGVLPTNPNFQLSPPPHTLGVQNCQGLVELFDLNVQATSAFSRQDLEPKGSLVIRDCAQVCLDGVRVPGVTFRTITTLSVYTTPRSGLPGIHVEDSTVFIQNTFAEGFSTPSAALTGFGGRGGAGLRGVNSSLYLGRLRLRGAESGGTLPGTPGAGGPALELIGCYAIVAGGSEQEFAGARGIYNTFANTLPFQGHPGSAIALRAGSIAFLASDLQLSPGLGTSEEPTAPEIAVDSLSLPIPLAHRLPTHALRRDLQGPTAILHEVIEGEPDAPVYRIFAGNTEGALIIPQTFGALILSLSVNPIEILPLDATGRLTSALSLPPIPALSGQQVIQQCAQLSGGFLWLSAPSAFTFP